MGELSAVRGLKGTMNTTEIPILTVSQLNQEAKALLEQNFGHIRIAGEISNWVCASSGHCYFSLKDEQAQVRCAFFRTRASRLTFQPENGLAVLLRAQVSLYPNRGDYQLIVSDMQPAGQGQLAALFAKLKAKLHGAGLFDEKHKCPLPKMPTQIGVITSPTGAALQDICKVLQRRFPLIPVTVYPAAVQGKSAPAELRGALAQAIAHRRCDVLILSRGGGSIEDLWAFNDEALAMDIHRCPIPVVTGIGHEIDFTIADFVADLRAPTPSAAAERVVPDQLDTQHQLAQSLALLAQLIQAHLKAKHSALKHLGAKLTHPKQLLQNQMQRVDFIEQRLTQALLSRLTRERGRFDSLQARMTALPWKQTLFAYQQRLNSQLTKLESGALRALDRPRTQLGAWAAALEQQSPLKLLARGYSVLSTDASPVIASVNAVRVGDQLVAKLADGELAMQVTNVLKKLTNT